jgi:hypothetical protein
MQMEKGRHRTARRAARAGPELAGGRLLAAAAPAPDVSVG